MPKKQKPKKKVKRATAYALVLVVLGALALATPGQAATTDLFTNAHWGYGPSEPKLLLGYAYDHGEGFRDLGESFAFSYSPLAVNLANEQGKLLEVGLPALGGVTVPGNDAVQGSQLKFSLAFTVGVMEVLYPTYGLVFNVPQENGKTETEAQYLLLLDGMKTGTKGKEVLQSLWALTGLGR